MDAFGTREQAFERAFAHEQEVHFMVLARRNAMIAQWVAQKLGYSGDTAVRYIEKIANALSTPSIGVKTTEEKVIERLVLDLTTCGWNFTREDVRKVMDDFEIKAHSVVLANVQTSARRS